jgi:hypothetical protein
LFAVACAVSPAARARTGRPRLARRLVGGCRDGARRPPAYLKKGAFLITLTKKLPSAHFDVLEEEMYTMSWGGATVFLHRKRTEPPVES